MGANASIQSNEIIENTEQILAIELLNASQALFFREEKTSDFLQDILSSYRELVPKVTEDRILHNDIELSVNFIRNLELSEEIFIST
jgi:histidine ammonia-lyase